MEKIASMFGKESVGEGSSLILPFAELCAAYPFNLAICPPPDLMSPKK